MKILIAGASSYVGAKIYADLKDKFHVIGTYNTNKLFPELKFLDITNKENVINLVLAQKPDIIIHVAANASPSWCEKNPEEAINVNQKSTEYFVEAANKINARIIYISSYVVLGHNTLYAKTKLASEDIIKNTKAGFIIIRPGHIVGYSPNTQNDRQFNRFLKNLDEGIPAVYDNYWKFQPSYLKHISEVIEKIIEMKISDKIIPVTCPELKTRFVLASDILSKFNIEVKEEDKNEGAQPIIQDLSILKELKLPQYNYDEMIKGIILEIKDYLKTR